MSLRSFKLTYKKARCQYVDDAIKTKSGVLLRSMRKYFWITAYTGILITVLEFYGLTLLRKKNIIKKMQGSSCYGLRKGYEVPDLLPDRDNARVGSQSVKNLYAYLYGKAYFFSPSFSSGTVS